MRYLGLDLGTKTLGVSLSDRLGLIASTYKTIRFNENDYESALKELEEIISEFKVEKIVLGLPKNMNNSLGFASERSMNFKKMIEEKYNIPKSTPYNIKAVIREYDAHELQEQGPVIYDLLKTLQLF